MHRNNSYPTPWLHSSNASLCARGRPRAGMHYDNTVRFVFLREYLTHEIRKPSPSPYASPRSTS